MCSARDAARFCLYDGGMDTVESHSLKSTKKPRKGNLPVEAQEESVTAGTSSEMDDFHADHQRRHHWWRNCCLGLLLVIFLVVLSGLWVIARSGFTVVPGISSLAYRLPEPSERIESNQADLDSLNATLEDANAAMDPATGVTEIAISEAQFNALLRQNNPDMNIAFVADRAEFYVPIDRGDSRLYVTVLASPSVEDGHLRVELHELKIGRLGIPIGIFNWLFKGFQTRLVDTNELIKQITFEEFYVRDDKLHLRGKLPAEFRGGGDEER